jgi:hypothetical protein
MKLDSLVASYSMPSIFDTSKSSSRSYGPFLLVLMPETMQAHHILTSKCDISLKATSRIFTYWRATHWRIPAKSCGIYFGCPCSKLETPADWDCNGWCVYHDWLVALKVRALVYQTNAIHASSKSGVEHTNLIL